MLPIHTMTNDTNLVQLFGSRQTWAVKFLDHMIIYIYICELEGALACLYHVQRKPYLILYQNIGCIICSVLQFNITIKEKLADP